MAKKKQMGRPPLPAGAGRDQFMQLRLTAAEKAAYKRAAKLAGEPLSEWIRGCLDKAAGGKPTKA